MNTVETIQQSMRRFAKEEAKRQLRRLSLTDWLESRHARAIAGFEGPNGSSFGMYSVNGHVFMIQHYPKDNGWEVYVVASAGNTIKGTLDALDKYIGRVC